MTQKELTKAEEQVMQFIWKLNRGFLKDIVENFPQPRPAYTTVSTVIRVLVRKKFVGYKTYGKINEYYPLISKTDYFKRKVKPLISNYLNGSTANLASFFAGDQLNLSELEEIKMLVDEKIKKLKTK
jgi:BlaI family transcriptional regulator, penicillinase repressor